MGRHDFGGDDEAGGPVDLAAIVADDALLDALGRHRRSPLSGPRPTPAAAAEAELTDLFTTWRATIDAEPVPEPPAVDSVLLVLHRTARRRSLRPMLGVAVAICALLVGSGAIGARTARPGDMLWPVTQVLWSDRADSVVAGDTTRVALGQARVALDAGLTSQARSALVVASTVLPRVAERDGHQDLKEDMDSLWSTLDWVQQQHAVTVAAPAPAGPSSAPEPGTAGPVGATAPSAPVGSTIPSSKPPVSSSDSGATSSHPAAPSTAASADPSPAPPPTSAPLPPAPPSPQLPATSTVPTIPTIPTTTVPTAPTVPGTPTSPAAPTPSTPAPSTDTPTPPSTSSTPSSPSEPPTTAPPETQEVQPIVPTESATVATVAQVGEQSVDPAQKVQQGTDSQTDGNGG